MTIKLHHGRWQDTLKNIDLSSYERRNVHCILDPPYSERTHLGQRSCDDLTKSKIHYACIDPDQVYEFFNFWTEKVFWILIFCDHSSFYLWEKASITFNRYTFCPVYWLKTDAAPRMSGDGPTNSCDQILVSRPKVETRCGSLPGYYSCQIDRQNIIGSKPLNLMRAIIRDYTKKDDLVIDPYSGTGSTLIAAQIEGRNAIGSEMNLETFERAQKRINAGYTPNMFDC
jgi:hypothetical protein